MSQYVAGSGISYRQFLQAQSFVDDICWSIAESGLKVGASIDTLHEQGARVESQLQNIDATLQEGFVTLHFDLKEVNHSLTEMTAMFEWGFGEIHTRLGAIKDKLEELVSIAKSPEQTWSFEQFAIARDAFRRGLIEEAIQYASRAIHGHQSHTGYLLDHRFHHLVGVIRLGDIKNRSDEIVDLAEAENAFLKAARYAEIDYRLDASRAMCCAGYAAYCQQKIDVAEKYTERSLSLHDALPEGQYQLAKIRFSKNLPGLAIPSLERAIRLDPLYAVKCFADNDFTNYEEIVAELIKKMSANLQHLSRKDAEQLKQKYSIAKSVGTPGWLSVLPDHYGHSFGQLSTIAHVAEQAAISADSQLQNQLPYLDVCRISERLKEESERLNVAINETRKIVNFAIEFLKRNPFRPDVSRQQLKEYGSGGGWIANLSNARRQAENERVIQVASDRADEKTRREMGAMQELQKLLQRVSA